jgi:hypothetical protein
VLELPDGLDGQFFKDELAARNGAGIFVALRLSSGGVEGLLLNLSSGLLPCQGRKYSTSGIQKPLKRW